MYTVLPVRRCIQGQAVTCYQVIHSHTKEIVAEYNDSTTAHAHADRLNQA